MYEANKPINARGLTSELPRRTTLSDGFSNSDPIEQTAATETVYRADNLAMRLQALAEKMDKKLHPVLRRNEFAAVEGQDKLQRDYPPLFDELRGKLDNLEAAMEYIERTLLRVEL
jgi:hypothetical protein